MLRTIALLGVTLFAQAAHAETLYVSDKLWVNLRATADKDAPATKPVASGTALEVLERSDTHMRVREPDGGEGWIEARLLAAEPPARAQLAAVKMQLRETKTALAKAAEELAQLKAAPPRAAPEPPAPPTPVEAPTPPSAEPEDPPLPLYLWLLISFAMLGVGFFAGIWWLRETYRKRLGGMHLRI